MNSARPQRILAVLGTRPEVIKLAPVLQCLTEDPDCFCIDVIAVEQQNALLHDALAEWGIAPARIVALPESRPLAGSLAACLVPLHEIIKPLRPDSVLVQGDTLTAFAASLAASYERRPVAHVEAGLRTVDPREPFPEEFHRRLIDTLAWVHYAPTDRARNNLLAEGCAADRVSVVGNTVVDAMRRMLGADPGRAAAPDPPPYRMVVTAHRRESFGDGIGNICEALGRLVRERNDLEIVYVLHSNPEAYQPVRQLLANVDRIRLVRPLLYRDFLSIVASAHVVLTDSGGIQEEAPYLGKPVLVARTRTERPEALEQGNAELVGTDPFHIAAAVCRLLDDSDLYLRRAARIEPFGDGRAAERIRDDLRRRWAQSIRCGEKR